MPEIQTTDLPDLSQAPARMSRSQRLALVLGVFDAVLFAVGVAVIA